MASLCVQEHLIDAPTAANLIAAMSPEADSLVFAQAVTDQAHITDMDLMTRLATEAQQLAAPGADAPAPHAPTSKDPSDVDFSTLAGLSDEEAKAFMLELHEAAQNHGASDLHLSAGAPP